MTDVAVVVTVETPPTTPEPPLTVATVTVALVQVPPVTLLLKVVVAPPHTVATPLIAVGVVLTAIACNVVQPATV